MSDISRCYAEALYSLCKEANTQAQTLNELNSLIPIIEAEPRFEKLLTSYELTKQEKRNILDECFKTSINAHLLNCMKLMCDKNEFRIFRQTALEFERIYNSENGIIMAELTSARKLSQAETDRLRQKLEDVSGKSVIIRPHIDKTCLGGIAIKYDDMSIDGSLKHRLEAVAKQIKTANL